MNAKPKNNFQNQFLWLLVVPFLILMGCRTTQPTANEPEAQIEDTAEVAPDFTEEDSLNALRILQEREAAILEYRESFPLDIRVHHVDLELSFDFENQSVGGKAKLLISPHFYPSREVWLDAKDYELGAISMIEGDQRNKLAYQYDNRRVQIYLPEEINREDSVWIEINYTAFPERNNEPGSAAITDTKGLYFIDPLDTLPTKPTMIWTQGETEHNSKWFPMIDKPNQRFTQTFKLNVPENMISLSNGELINQQDMGDGIRQDTWEMSTPHAPYLAALAIGEFDEVRSDWRGMPVGYFVEKGYGAGAEKVFANTPEMIEFFSEKLGVDFPWSKYDQVVVRDFVSGAMENTTVSIFMEELRLDEREAIDSDWDYIIAHELFHQWFGDYVTLESWSNLTLNEAFANYSEYLWNEHKYGRDEADIKLAAERDNYFYEAQTKQEDLIRFSFKNAEDMFDSHSYSKGGAILHMLRKIVGDEAFYASLQLYLERHALGTVEVHELRLAFEEITGRDLNWFFNQWFLDKGHPELLVQADFSQPDDILISVYQTQDLNSTRLYKIPFEVSWYVDGARRSKRFVLERAFQQFALQNGDPVDLVLFDEQKEILAIKTNGFSAEMWERQFMQSEFGVSRYEALDSLKNLGNEEVLKRVIVSGLSDSFDAVQESSLLFLLSKVDWFEKDPSLEEKVLDLAIRGQNNSLKSTALDVLAANFPEKYNSTFRLYLNNESYLVAGSALSGLIANTSSPISQEEIESFEKETNFRLVVPVAEYYLTNAVKGKGSWFQSKTTELNGDGLYYFLGYYGEYFSMNPEEGEEEAISYLLNSMEFAPQITLRLGAFQALLGFADKDEVVRELKRIGSKEKDEFVKQYYDYFLSSLEIEN